MGTAPFATMRRAQESLGDAELTKQPKDVHKDVHKDSADSAVSSIA
jgi:hypothetical protein